MASLLSADQAEVIVSRHLVGIMDGGADLRDQVALESWLNAGESRVFLRTEEDALHATLRFEVWDDVAVFDEREWSRSDVIELHMPTGRIGADQIDAGFSPPLFALPSPGRYRVRVAVREEPEPPAAPDTPDWEWPEPVVVVLLQFWSAGD